MQLKGRAVLAITVVFIASTYNEVRQVQMEHYLQGSVGYAFVSAIAAVILYLFAHFALSLLNQELKLMQYTRWSKCLFVFRIIFAIDSLTNVIRIFI